MNKALQLELRKARIAISPVCNFHCKYCDGNKGRQLKKPGAMEDFRSKPLERGVIDTETYIKIIKTLYDIGFRGITLTGGEPFLNEDWDKIVKKAKQIGMKQICVTTNGTFLKYYLGKNGCLPRELTLLTISFDTFDPKEFERITGVSKNKLHQIIEGVRIVRERNPGLTIRANKVVTRSGLKSLSTFIVDCDKLFDEVNLLNLILKEPKNKINKKFFEREFVSPYEIMKILSQGGYKFVMGPKYEPVSQTPNGLKIILKDTDQALRSTLCDHCPVYCQEGFYTIRVATDGTIRACIDYKNELPYIDGVDELKKGILIKTLREFMKETLEAARLQNTLNDFFKRYNINIRKII